MDVFNLWNELTGMDFYHTLEHSPEDPETSHSPDHLPSTTQMGQVRIWKISDYQSKSGRIWSLGVPLGTAPQPSKPPYIHF